MATKATSNNGELIHVSCGAAMVTHGARTLVNCALRLDGDDMPGLTTTEARSRLAQYGPNALPEARAPSLVSVFLRQFLSPLIYILLAAALVSLALGDIKDALFIGAVLLINGIIGAAQEYSAGRAAAALRSLEQPRALVIRDGVRQEIDARELVPGDVALLEAGSRVPADLQLVEAADLHCDESLLTGESESVEKSAIGPEGGGRHERRRTMAFAGSIITRGRGRGHVTATGAATEIGKIAEEIGKRSISQPPLMIRLEHFSRMIAVAVGVAIALLVFVGLLREMEFRDLFMMSVGLAVSAIPEGLPVAISVALAIAMRRMAKVHVIVRKMPAVESLGSCTMIATDKTGTLTLNELTVTEICLPDGTMLMCEAGQDIESCSIRGPQTGDEEARVRVAALLRAAALPNEARLLKDQDGWKGMGDTVDVALLTAARKGGIAHDEIRERYPLVARIPYEPDLKYAASFHRREKKIWIFVKGAPETLIAMSDRMDMGGRTVPIERDRLLRQKEALAAEGLRVLGFAEGEIASDSDGGYGDRHLVNLAFLGLVGMQDPVRPEAPRAIHDCHRAGIEVSMVTGDDPKTASVIARQAGFVFTPDQVVTGEQVRRAEEDGQDALDRLTRHARIYARVEPTQKLSIVLSLARNGHFVAVTGDGVNDAPALKHAHVGVAMGRKGTDVAKESADIIITDDNFASIVNGIHEGRVAYANIRKVIFMLVSTGAAEVALFLLAIPAGLPMPLLPVQLLWLNLVTNGIQDVALAAEKPEGDELTYPPRQPREPIFDRVMIRRVWYSTLVMGVGGFATFYWLLERGYGEEQTRNLLLLLFVLFENFQTLNSRSEQQSAFRQGFFGNPLLVTGVIGAQALHVAAMYIPGLSDTLRVAPVSFDEWSVLLSIASVLLLVMEFEKWWGRRHDERRALAIAEAVPFRNLAYGEGHATAGEQELEGPDRAALKARWVWQMTAGAFAVLIFGGGWLYWISHREAATRYVTETVGRGSVVRAVTASGVINPTSSKPVGTHVSGVIQELYCDLGDKVTTGQLCARIDPSPYRSVVAREQAELILAKARLKKDEVRLTRAKAAYERNRVLAKRKAISRSVFGRSRAAYEKEQARTRLDEAEIARRRVALHAAEIDLAHTEIASPIDGTVVSRGVEVGETVAASMTTPLFLVAADLAAVRVDVNVSAKDIGDLKLGDKASFTVDAVPDRVFSGEVSQIGQSPRMVQGVASHDVVISAPNPDLALAPGMRTTIKIVVDRRDAVMRVSNQALRYSANRLDSGDQGLETPPAGWARLWILRHGKPTIVAVQLGLDDGAYTEVLKGDLHPPDQLILGEAGGRSENTPDIHASTSTEAGLASSRL